MTLGERLKELRQAHRMSQNQLAEISGVPRPTITLIEREEQKSLTLHNAVRLARAFHLSMDKFLEGVEIERPAPTYA